jgi:APA family basic amino acid/polyamine antiporter
MKTTAHTFASVRRACFRRKSVAQAIGASNEGGGTTVGLCRTLTAVDLILYGVGSSVGAGIYVLVGLGATLAGPAISLSFLGCGMACILTSFCYAEFASRIPVTGSAFVYAYIAFGEVWAWLVGWNLTLGYGFTTSVVARAWGDYLGNLLRQSLIQAGASPWWGQLVQYSTELPIFGTGVSYRCSPLSMLIVYINTVILLRGVKDSSRFNNAMTILNVSLLILVIVAGLGSQSVKVSNLTPFFAHDVSGVVAGAGLVFFAFIGFDMVASLSEEVVHPERNMPIGIVGSLVISTVLYVCVALVVVGMAPIKILGEVVPIINALQANACCTHAEQQELTAEHFCLKSDCYPAIRPWLGVMANWVSAGAVMGLMASVFTSLMGQPRILYSLARDGLIHPLFCVVDPVTQVPRMGIILTGILTALLACLAPMNALANLISLGTLMVFTFVDVGVLFLRLRELAKTTSPPLHRETDVTHMVSMLIVGFTLTMLGSAVCLSHTSWTTLAYLLGAISAILAVLITVLPSTWTPKFQPDTDSSLDHQHAFFQCPGAPFVPLAGIACNTFMMGSLSLSSWGLCLVWMAAGTAVYFCYGMHHSVLGHEEEAGLRLVPIDETEEPKSSHASTVGGNESTSLLSGA